MPLVYTSRGPIERSRLVTRDIITEDQGSRAIATEWYLVRTEEEWEAEFQAWHAANMPDLLGEEGGYRAAFMAGRKACDPVRRAPWVDLFMPMNLSMGAAKLGG